MGPIPQVFRMTKIQFEVRRVDYKLTLPLRQKVLKPFLQEEECINPGDDLPSTHHFACYAINSEMEKIVSIASFIQEPHPIAPDAQSPYRLRGMATDIAAQGSGAGALVLNEGMKFLKSQTACNFVWCNAREKAFGFYQKMGFTTHGEMFDIKDIGPHKVMYKWY